MVLERTQLNFPHEVSSKISFQGLGEIAWLWVLTALWTNSRINSKFGIKKHLFCAGKKRTCRPWKFQNRMMRPWSFVLIISLLILISVGILPFFFFFFSLREGGRGEGLRNEQKTQIYKIEKKKHNNKARTHVWLEVGGNNI